MVDSLINNEKVKTEQLNEQLNKVEKSWDTTVIFKEYKDIICNKKKNIACLVHHKKNFFSKVQREQKVYQAGKIV